ncbi:MAG TPA: HDIG domain-containing protein [Candidatus Paceibacterota bacterium]|nr:HDIG domain-containing protein [Candidatus Paceibacterota bacterium]
MNIHPVVRDILIKLNDNGHAAYAVGGCVRDLLMRRTPGDWDIATAARPERIQELFPDSFYENRFGTVTIKTGEDDDAVRHVEVTPFRTEGAYSDRRHPDAVTFADDINDDLARRDFTMNAVAVDAAGTVVDPFGGKNDIERGLIRAVRDPVERFAEDALRLMRAVRLATVLGFTIEPATLSAVQRHARLLKDIAAERIRDELAKIVMADRAEDGIRLMEESGLLKYVIPELRDGIGVEQNLHHIYTVWEHNVRALGYSAGKGYSLIVRLASLLHDVGKPKTKRGEGRNCTFYAHDVVGARMTARIMERLKFSNEIADKVTLLVRYHLFYYNVGEVSASSVRRLVANVGLENMEDLLKVREADRIGSGTPKAVPYKLRHLKYMIDKVSHDPISVKMLKVDGEDIMKELKSPPGPKVGLILNSLLAEVLDDPSGNTKAKLKKRIHELDAKSPEELKKSLERIKKAVEQEEKSRMKKYYV